MKNRELIAIINSNCIILIVICIGLFIDFIQKILTTLLSSIFNSKFTNIFMNRITFIGVIHHELSHTLFALITGAKITNIHLFKPDKKDNSLGSVEYSTRGPFMLRGIQRFLSAIAPIICGFISCILICKFLLSDNIWLNIIIGFVLLCIILHMDLSWADIKSAILGLPACLIILFIIFYTTQFNILLYIPYLKNLFI